MSDFEFALQKYVEEWAVLLITNICHECGIPQAQLQIKCNKIEDSKEAKEARLPISDGFNHYKETQKEDARREFDALCSVIFEFSQNPFFPKLFKHMIITTRAAFSAFVVVDPNDKKIGIHTDDLTDEKDLTPLEQYECCVFTFLSSAYGSAAQNPQVNLDEIPQKLISSIFSFMNANEPNAVRKSAGEILAALSTSTLHCGEICDIFWKQFGLCKKDNDYRIFATWVDGIMNIHFSFQSIESSEQAMQFLKTFISVSKKIDRGVLRSKFLDAIASITSKLASTNSALRDDYMKTISDIWNVAMTWSKKGKHTAFCYCFLCKLLSVSPFLFGTCAEDFAKKLSKQAKDGEMEILDILPLFFKSIPANVDEETISRLFNTVFLPNLIGAKEEKRCSRFKLEAQNLALVNFFIGVGNRSSSIIIKFAYGVLKAEKPNEDHKLVRALVLKALSEIDFFKNQKAKESSLAQCIDKIIIMRDPVMPLALKLFPVVRPDDSNEVSKLAKSVFEMVATLPEAADAVCRFVEVCVSLKENIETALLFMENSLQNIELLTKLGTAFSKALGRCLRTDGSDVYEDAEINFDRWMQFRVKLDSNLLEKAITGDAATIKCLIEFNSESIHALDNGNTTLAQLIQKEGKTDVVAKAKLITPAYGCIFISEIANRINQCSPKFLQFAATVAHENTQTNTDFVNSLLQAVLGNPEIAIAFSTLPSTHWKTL